MVCPVNAQLWLHSACLQKSSCQNGSGAVYNHRLWVAGWIQQGGFDHGVGQQGHGRQDLGVAGADAGAGHDQRPRPAADGQRGAQQAGQPAEQLRLVPLLRPHRAQRAQRGRRQLLGDRAVWARSASRAHRPQMLPLRRQVLLLHALGLRACLAPAPADAKKGCTSADK